MLAQLGQLDMDSTTQASTQIGGAGQDVAEMLVPHKAMVVFLEDLLNLFSHGKIGQNVFFTYRNTYFNPLITYLLQANAETLEDLPHVATFLHRDDSQVILLIHPDEESLVVIVPKRRQKIDLKKYLSKVEMFMDVFSECFLSRPAILDVHSPDASAIRPVTGHTSAGQQGRDGLIKQEVITDQLLLLSVSHGLQRIVLSLELTIQAGESCRGRHCARVA